MVVKKHVCGRSPRQWDCWLHLRGVSWWDAVCVWCWLQKQERSDNARDESEKKKANYSAGRLFGVSCFTCCICFVFSAVKKAKLAHTRLQSFQVPELILVLGSQPAGDVSHKPGGRLPLLSARPAVTPSQPLRGLLPVLLLGEQRHNGCEHFA